MEHEMRLAGYDRPNSGLFGLIDIRLDGGNNGRIAFSLDMGAGGNTDNGALDADESITYLLYDSPTTMGTGATDLGRTVNGTTELVAEGIEAMGLVYAFDSDNDGRLDWNDVNADDLKQPNEGEFWAVDTTGDNLLDTNLDTNFDGSIDENDTLYGAALPTLPGGGTTVPSDRIRAVKIMLLARSKNQDLNYQDAKSYRVGYLPSIAGDGFHRRLLTTTVRCRNLGL
jgi:type IV pilus assembly protein PilW